MSRSCLLCFAAVCFVGATPSIESQGEDVMVNGDEISFISSQGTVKVSELKTFISQLNQALKDVNDLKKSVTNLTTQLDICNQNVSLLSAIALDHDTQINDLGALKDTTNDLNISLNGIFSTVEHYKNISDEQYTGLDYEISNLQDAVDKLTNNSGTKCAALGAGSFGSNSLVQDSVLALKHNVGFQISQKCPNGYAGDGAVDLTCFPSGKYCSSEGFPFKKCDTQPPSPTCKKCPAGCSRCLDNDGGCTACNQGLFILGGKCVKETNCAGYAQGGALKQGITNIGIKLSNNKVTRNGACLMDKNNRVYEAFPCTDLVSPGQSCTAVNNGNAENTCSKAGYMLFTFRNKLHYDLMFQRFSGLFRSHIRTTNVYCKQDAGLIAGRPYTQCAMNSEDKTSRCAKDWTTSDGGDWWLRDTPYSEPNGDAKQYWFLRFDTNSYKTTGFNFNDYRYAQSTGNLYFCMPKK